MAKIAQYLDVFGRIIFSLSRIIIIPSEMMANNNTNIYDMTVLLLMEYGVSLNATINRNNACKYIDATKVEWIS